MNPLVFLFQYIIKPRTVGAILPSSTQLAKRMVKQIDFEKARYIVEYGPGTGVFTDRILENRKADTKIMLIEQNEEFYRLLKEKYQYEKNVILVNGTAEDVDSFLRHHEFPAVDYVVSGLPFASLPQSVSGAILEKTKKLIKNNGKFITFQYTLLKRELISCHFNEMTIERELWNLPPAYVFSCRN